MLRRASSERSPFVIIRVQIYLSSRLLVFLSSCLLRLLVFLSSLSSCLRCLHSGRLSARNLSNLSKSSKISLSVRFVPICEISAPRGALPISRSLSQNGYRPPLLRVGQRNRPLASASGNENRRAHLSMSRRIFFACCERNVSPSQNRRCAACRRQHREQPCG